MLHGSSIKLFTYFLLPLHVNSMKITVMRKEWVHLFQTIVPTHPCRRFADRSGSWGVPRKRLRDLNWRDLLDPTNFRKTLWGALTHLATWRKWQSSTWNLPRIDWGLSPRSVISLIFDEENHCIVMHHCEPTWRTCLKMQYTSTAKNSLPMIKQRTSRKCADSVFQLHEVLLFVFTWPQGKT